MEAKTMNSKLSGFQIETSAMSHFLIVVFYYRIMVMYSVFVKTDFFAIYELPLSLHHH